MSLQIVALKDLDDRRLITTLLPNSSPISKSLKNALVVMAVGRKGVLEVKPNSRTSHSVYAGALWKEYRHRPLGVEKTRQSPELVPIPDVPLSKKWSNKVNIWIEKQVDPTSFVDPHLPDSDVADQIQTTTLRDYKESLAPATKPITKRARTAKGNPEVSRRPPGSEVPIHDTVKDHHSIGRLSSGKQNQLDDQTSLIDASPSEKLQDPGKTQPRDLRRTMQQRTPAPGITGGNTALMKRFERATISLVAFARRCPGQIHLRVDIGRFLIKDQTSSAEFKVRPFNVSEWPSAFPDSSTGVTGFETHFTNM